MTEEQIFSDPLYLAVLNAENEREAQTALNNLRSIRGNQAVQAIIDYLKEQRK